MKLLIVAISIFLSTQTYAETMGQEAVEMFGVLTHPQVKECLAKEDIELVNVTIKKAVARCPGCNSYTIVGNQLEIDVPRKDKTVISITGKGHIGIAGNWVQSYSCKISEAR